VEITFRERGPKATTSVRNFLKKHYSEEAAGGAATLKEVFCFVFVVVVTSPLY